MALIPKLLPIPRRLELTGIELDAAVLSGEPELQFDSAWPAEGYRLSVSKVGIQVVAADDAGAFYAHRTLRQLRSQYGQGKCPALSIEDYPELRMRGFMLDVSRDRIPRLEELLQFAELLAGWKINCFMLYMEHTFAYREHQIVWQDASPFTAEEIRQLDRFCRERFIQLIPMQNTLGHLSRWLCHEPYRGLAECPDGVFSSWQMSPTDPFSLCPTDPRSLQLISGLLDELLPNFSSEYFMGGCDETYDIGLGRSCDICGEIGRDQVLLNYISGLHDVVVSKKHKLMIFSDMFNKSPEVLRALAPDIHLIEWGYGRNYPFEEHGREFHAAGHKFSFMVSNSNYSSVAGRSYRWRGNISQAVRAALETGAEGIINTEWGDFGHWHNWTTALPGIAFGAAMSWGSAANVAIDVGEALDLWCFDGCVGLGALVIDLGKSYAHTAGADDTDALYMQFYRSKLRKGEAPLDRLTLDGLARVAEDCRDIEHRLDALESIPDIARQELLLALQWSHFAEHCAREWLSDPHAVFLNELQPAVQKQLAEEFKPLIAAALAVRDRQYRPGGRAAALKWLERYWNTVCGYCPFPDFGLQETP